MKNNTDATFTTNINDVTLQGIIVHKFVTPNIAIITLSTGNATPTVNYPKVLFFGDLRAKADAFEERDHVKITGNVQSSRPKPGIKNQITIAIFGESIEATPSVMQEAFGINRDVSYKPFKNEMKLAGVVTGIESPAPNLIRLRISVRKNNRQSFVSVVHFTKTPEALLSEIHPRDPVCIVGCIQTSKKTVNDKTNYYENYVALEVTKIM